MEVQVIESWVKKGVQYYKISVPGALNKPILKVPASGTDAAKAIPGMRCQIHPNHHVRKDGTCSRSSRCVSYKKVCPAS